MNRAGFAAQSLGQMIHINIGAEIRCVHFVCFRMEDQVCAGGLAQRCITLDVARIGCQIFSRSELNRIDKVGDNRAVVLCNRAGNQTLMAFMQVTHGRNQTDGQSLCAPCLDLCANFFYCLNDGNHVKLLYPMLVS